MKKLIFFLVCSLFLSCSKEETKTTESSSPPKNTTTIKNNSINLQITGISPSTIGTSIDASITGTTLYAKDGIEHLIISPTLFYNDPLIPAIHLIKKNGEWIYESNYIEGAMGAGRDSELLDDSGTIVFADHGLELRNGTWPFGNIMISKTIGEKLIWSKISDERSFYHSVSTGDLNNDNLKDIIGLNMGTKGSWGDNLHSYIQKPDGTFEANKNLISYSNWKGAYGAGAVLIANILGDSRPEIIRADYRVFSAFPSPRYSFAIFSYSATTNKYEFIKTPGIFGFATRDLGVTSMKSVDLDNDGDLDIALAYEGDQTNGIEIWTNNGNGNYVFSNQRLEYKFNELQFREFEIADINNDGWQDIILNAWAGNLWKSNYSNGEVLLNNLVWKNTKGTFEKINTPYRVVLGEMPSYIKAFIVNKKLKFIGIKGDSQGKLIINDISPDFNSN